MSSFDLPAFRLPCTSSFESFLFQSSFLPAFSFHLSLLTSGFHRSCLIPHACRGIGFPRKDSLTTYHINNAAWRRCICGSSKNKTSRHLALALALPTLILPPATLVPGYPCAPPTTLHFSHQACLLSTRSSYLRPSSFARIRFFRLLQTCIPRRPRCVC